MKKLSVFCSAILVCGFSSFTYAEPKIPSHMENDLIQVCEAMRSDRRIRLLRAVEQSRQSYGALAKGLKCNGASPIEFALDHNAEVTAKMFAAKTGVDIQGLLVKR